jgi:hypothetical protein
MVTLCHLGPHQADSFCNDLHEDSKADYVLANRNKLRISNQTVACPELDTRVDNGEAARHRRMVTNVRPETRP